MELTQEMLNAAMKKAIKVGIFPKYADMETYLKHWEGMEEVLKAALQGTQDKSKSLEKKDD